MKNSLRVLISLSGTLVLFLAFVNPADRLYKNLKVLPKDITKKQMDSVMDHFAKSLGVKCNYCHVRNEAARAFDFANDSIEHKKIARDMLRMQIALNRKYFDIRNAKKMDTKLEVTCYTCHNGKAHPASRVPVPVEKE